MCVRNQDDCVRANGAEKFAWEWLRGKCLRCALYNGSTLRLSTGTHRNLALRSRPCGKCRRDCLCQYIFFSSLVVAGLSVVVVVVVVFSVYTSLSHLDCPMRQRNWFLLFYAQSTANDHIRAKRNVFLPQVKILNHYSVFSTHSTGEGWRV